MKLCSAFNPSSAHTPEQWAANAAAPGEQLGVRCLAQWSHLSRGIEGGENARYSLPPLAIPARAEIEPTTSGYKSDALSIRPRLVEIRYLLMFISRLNDRFMCHLNNILGNTAICHNTLKSHKMVFVAGISFKKYTF